MGCVLAVALCAIAVFVRNVERLGDAAEHQAMAMNYVNAACCDYIAAHHDWPRSWEDLEGIRPTVGFVTFPRDRQWVEQQMTIDFQAKLDDIARQRSENFTGFATKEKPYYAYSYEGVIETARQAKGESATQFKGN